MILLQKQCYRCYTVFSRTPITSLAHHGTTPLHLFWLFNSSKNNFVSKRTDTTIKNWMCFKESSNTDQQHRSDLIYFTWRECSELGLTRWLWKILVPKQNCWSACLVKFSTVLLLCFPLKIIMSPPFKQLPPTNCC